jgi:hypothetical protein
MRSLPIILLVTLIFSACIQVNKTERRVVELPKTLTVLRGSLL